MLGPLSHLNDIAIMILLPGKKEICVTRADGCCVIGHLPRFSPLALLRANDPISPPFLLLFPSRSPHTTKIYFWQCMFTFGDARQMRRFVPSTKTADVNIACREVLKRSKGRRRKRPAAELGVFDTAAISVKRKVSVYLHCCGGKRREKSGFMDLYKAPPAFMSDLCRKSKGRRRRKKKCRRRGTAKRRSK